MAVRAIKVLAGLGVLGGSVAASKRTDADVLARVGSVAAGKVAGALPDPAAVAGPMAAFKPGRVLPVEERVRVRIDADKDMLGATVDVLPGAAPGEVKLRGVVPSEPLRQRAATIALGTVGVEKVLNEVAVPE